MRWLLVVVVALLPAVGGGETLPCTPVPGDLFQAAPSVFAKGLPEGARLAGSGRTLGVLVPKLPGGHTLFLVRGEKIVREYWLAAPKDKPFPRPPGFFLADNGNVVVLRSREFLAVYVGAVLTAVIEGDLSHAVNAAATRSELYWSPEPGLDAVTRSLLLKKDLGRFRPEEWAPLLVHSELDGSDQRVVLRLDEARLKKWEPFPPFYHVLLPVVRPDGKLWMAGRFTGEIMLADAGGHVLRSRLLQLDLKRPEDDPEVRKQVDEEDRRTTGKLFPPKGGDATRKPPKQVVTFSFNTSPLFERAHARGRDLVLVLATYEPPSGSIVVVRDGDDASPCYAFPQTMRAGGDSASLQMTVTDDAVWFREPFGFIPWESLEALVEKQEKPKTDRP